MRFVHGQVMHGQALIIVVHVVETMPFFSGNHDNNVKMPLLVFINVLSYV